MKKGAFFVCLLGIFAFGSFAIAADEPVEESDGSALYRQHCASCHGDDGSETPVGSVPIKGQSPEEVKTKLAGYVDDTYGGKNKLMMQKALKKLSPEEIASIEAYMETIL